MKLLTKAVRLIYKLIRKRSEFPMTVSFYRETEQYFDHLEGIKEYYRWYINLPSYPGPKAALEMVLGADKLCDYLSNGKVELFMQISPEPFADHDGFFTLEGEDRDSGAWYNYEKVGYHEKEWWDFWLCDVCLYVLGEFPDKIYFKVL